MLFKNEDASLKLDIVNYELPADGGAPDSDDRNWLVLRGFRISRSYLCKKPRQFPFPLSWG